MDSMGLVAVLQERPRIFKHTQKIGRLQNRQFTILVPSVPYSYIGISRPNFPDAALKRLDYTQKNHNLAKQRPGRPL